MVRWRMWVVAFATALAAMALSGCEPYSPAYRAGTAEMNIEVKADGTAVTKVFLDASRHSEAELLAVGEAASGIFTDASATSRVSIDSNGGGSPFAVVITEGAFVPGDHPMVAFDTTGAITYLLRHGCTSVGLSITTPQLPRAARWALVGEPTPGADGFSSSVAEPQLAPQGTITLDSRVSGGAVFWAYGPLIASTLLLTLAVASLLRRRRRAAMALAAATIVTFVTSAIFGRLFLALAALAVSGGPSWPSQNFAPLLITTTLLFFPGAATIFVLGAAGVPRHVVRFAPPPGWPPVPEHWLPSFPWLPDPTWPQPPENWIFLVEIPRNDAGPRPRPSTAKARTWVTIYASHLARERREPTGI